MDDEAELADAIVAGGERLGRAPRALRQRLRADQGELLVDRAGAALHRGIRSSCGGTSSTPHSLERVRRVPARAAARGSGTARTARRRSAARAGTRGWAGAGARDGSRRARLLPSRRAGALAAPTTITSRARAERASSRFGAAVDVERLAAGLAGVATIATGPRGSPITSATWRQSSRRYLGSHAVAATTPSESAHSADAQPHPGPRRGRSRRPAAPSPPRPPRSRSCR